MASAPSSLPSPKKLRQQAKSLLRGLQAQDPDSIRRYQAVWPAGTEPGLNRCLHILAREHGQPDWETLLAGHETPSSPTSSHLVPIDPLIDGLAEGRSMLVTGGPGCGKTVLLRHLLQALALRRSGPPIFLAIRARLGGEQPPQPFDMPDVWTGLPRDVRQRIRLIEVEEAQHPLEAVWRYVESKPAETSGSIICVDELSARPIDREFADAETVLGRAITDDEELSDDEEKLINDENQRLYREALDRGIVQMNEWIKAIRVRGHALVMGGQSPSEFPGFIADEGGYLAIGALLSMRDEVFGFFVDPTPPERFGFRVMKTRGIAPTAGLPYVRVTKPVTEDPATPQNKVT